MGRTAKKESTERERGKKNSKTVKKETQTIIQTVQKFTIPDQIPKVTHDTIVFSSLIPQLVSDIRQERSNGSPAWKEHEKICFAILQIAVDSALKNFHPGTECYFVNGTTQLLHHGTIVELLADSDSITINGKPANPFFLVLEKHQDMTRSWLVKASLLCTVSEVTKIMINATHIRSDWNYFHTMANGHENLYPIPLEETVSYKSNPAVKREDLLKDYKSLLKQSRVE